MTHRMQAVNMRPIQIVLLLCMAAPVAAQESDNDILNEIVVYATRMESSVRVVAR